MSGTNYAWLREDLAAAWRGRDPFSAAKAQQGAVYRDKEGRRTLRFEIEGRGYFLKLHQGVGWKEICKNLMQGRLPVLGASNEYDAIRALEKLQLDTLSVAGYGNKGLNPATQLSFLITDELTGVESLEDFCAHWPQQPPAFALKRKLIERVAIIARQLHAAGINHRDFYLCHFLLETNGNAVSADTLATQRLYLMDLHRAQIRKVVPRRWLIKDLGGLYYSALDIGLNRRDIFRFIRGYTQQPLRNTFTKDQHFWNAVRQRAHRIYVRDHHREPQSAAWLSAPSFLDNFIDGKRLLPEPASLTLIIDGTKKLFHVESVLRLLPGKRVVLKGSIDNKAVVAKLFTRNRSSARHIQREQAGHACVSAAGISCPALLGLFTTDCGRFEGLIYSFIADAEELSACWRDFTVAQKQHWLDQIMRTMLPLHAAGAYQDDIHANNFLIRDDKLYLLDLGSIVLHTKPLARTASMANLGQLISQFDIGERSLLKSSLDWYFVQRDWNVSPELLQDLQTCVNSAWQQRKRDYLGKALRDCSLTAFDKNARQVWACRRSWMGNDLARFRRDPDAFMAQGTLLKAGNTATVVRATIDDKPIVIKRYNIKNWPHAISRSVRPTRAEHTWLYAHLMEIAGIDSLKPVALLEKRYGPLRSTAYFICEWIDAPDLLSIGQQRALTRNELDALQSLLQQMQTCRLSHGDFKANNLLLRNASIALIDLDAMREHSSNIRFRRAFKRDLDRLQRNWPADRSIFKQVQGAINSAFKAD